MMLALLVMITWMQMLLMKNFSIICENLLEKYQVLKKKSFKLNKEYLSMISHCDSAFEVWNTLTSPELQTPNIVEKESSGDEFDQHCYMVKGLSLIHI